MGLWHAAQRQVTADLLVELEFFNGNVFNSRMPVIRRDQLPCARIFTAADARTPDTTMNVVSPWNGRATLTIQVTVEAAADPAASDLLDLYCEAVEIKLLQSQAWLCGVGRIASLDTLYEHDASGEMRTTTASISFVLEYWQCATEVITDLEGKPLGELERVLMKIDVIDPAADPNTTGHPTEPPDGYPGGYPGPDGRAEIGMSFEIAKTPPSGRLPLPPRPPAGSGVTTRRTQ